MRSTVDALPLSAERLDRVWSMLDAAVADRDSPLRLLTIATSSADGPDARIVVLRATNRAARTLTCYSDNRAAKVKVIAADPRVAVVVYDPASRIQLRLAGVASVSVGGPLVDAAWANVGAAGREAYRTADSPGTAITSPAEGWPDAVRSGRADFALLTVTLSSIETLELAASGHLRARWTASDKIWSGTWLVP